MVNNNSNNGLVVKADSDDNRRPPGGAGGAAVGVGVGRERKERSVPGDWNPLRAVFRAI